MSELDKSHDELMRKIGHFTNALIHLRYEGKPRLGSNLKQMKATTSVLKQAAVQCFKVEEKVLFPFLKKHIPKLEPIVRLLESEHENFKAQFKDFQFSLERLSNRTVKNGRARLAGRVQETGVYMAYFLKNHIRAESEFVNKAIRSELHIHELIQLKKRMSERVNRGHEKGRYKKDH